MYMMWILYLYRYVPLLTLALCALYCGLAFPLMLYCDNGSAPLKKMVAKISVNWMTDIVAAKR